MGHAGTISRQTFHRRRHRRRVAARLLGSARKTRRRCSKYLLYSYYSTIADADLPSAAYADGVVQLWAAGGGSRSGGGGNSDKAVLTRIVASSVGRPITFMEWRGFGEHCYEQGSAKRDIKDRRPSSSKMQAYTHAHTHTQTHTQTHTHTHTHSHTHTHTLRYTYIYTNTHTHTHTPGGFR